MPARLAPLVALLACTGAPVPVDGTAGDTAAPPDDTGGTAPPAWSDPATCTEDVPLGSVDGLVRWPYLQHVTEDAATIAFGVDPGVVTGRITLSRDGGWGEAQLSAATTVDLIRIDDSDDDELPEAERGAEQSMALHHARLAGLEPGTEYCYRVEVSDGETGASVLASGIRFRTAPADPTTGIRFLVLGDMGAGTEAQDLVRDVMLRHAEGAHLLITTGDNAYGDGDRDELHHHVFAVYQDILARMPVYPTAGNHDYKTDQAQPYLDSFFLPTDADRPDHAERYYTAGFGPLHLIALDTETPAWQPTTDEGLGQTDWLSTHGVHTDRPWPVAAYHQPARAGHPDRGVHPVALAQWDPVLAEAGVPLVLQGHDHYYQRFASVRDGEPATMEEGGVTYVVTAGGGQGLYEMDETEPFLQAAEQRHHFLLGEADGCTLTLQAVDVHDEVFDELTLDRCP